MLRGHYFIYLIWYGFKIKVAESTLDQFRVPVLILWTTPRYV